ncbi:hypothetical protein C2845_PM13G07530 [Panicum miliaceum]|uniref:BTB domain-containing protein n=1 Tax=Panicum miliaceum TaxID=4540 RepID=A0A3L6RL56_PANMI|nr:hypothetical protein C2845_PM13G07530 [Panicum miliaceum]
MGLSSPHHTSLPVVFNGENPMQGFTKFMRKDLELSLEGYMQDGCLVIECDLTVIKEIQVKKTAITSDFDIHGARPPPPPPDLSHDLRRLLESKEEADVTFKVKGEVFRAHKILLAVRSPVFKVEFYGPMSDMGEESKTVRIDVQSVAYTLALAAQHHCIKLKNACIEFIINRNRMDVVLASQGYEHLKRACPDVAVELWEKAAKSSMTRCERASS